MDRECLGLMECLGVVGEPETVKIQFSFFVLHLILCRLKISIYSETYTNWKAFWFNLGFYKKSKNQFMVSLKEETE